MRLKVAEHLYKRGALFGIAIHHNDGLGVVGNGHNGGSARGLGGAYGGEKYLDTFGRACHIHIAHHDNGLILGVIPSVIIFPKRG